MIQRAIDTDGDWTFGRGKQSYVLANNAVMQNLQTRLLEFLNDCFFNMSAGIDWIRLLGMKNTQNELLLTIRSIILRSAGVVRINTLTFSVVNRALTVNCNIDTLYTQNQNQSIEVLNV